MTDKQKKKISKFLSFILRHKPEFVGLNLDESGWAETKELLEKVNRGEHSLTFEQLKEVVETNEKKRFVFSDDLSRIRASQGHSLKVDLQLEAIEPPEVLYHGTVLKNLDSIQTKGLIKGERHHVHLSFDEETARKVGMRYGKPVILKIKAKQMHDKGMPFFRSENGVWLTDAVAPEYIEFPDSAR